MRRLLGRRCELLRFLDYVFPIEGFGVVGVGEVGEGAEMDIFGLGGHYEAGCVVEVSWLELGVVLGKGDGTVEAYSPHSSMPIFPCCVVTTVR